MRLEMHKVLLDSFAATAGNHPVATGIDIRSGDCKGLLYFEASGVNRPDTTGNDTYEARRSKPCFSSSTVFTTGVVRGGDDLQGASSSRGTMNLSFVLAQRKRKAWAPPLAAACCSTASTYKVRCSSSDIRVSLIDNEWPKVISWPIGDLKE
jgi:hypothetical protein